MSKPIASVTRFLQRYAFLLLLPTITAAQPPNLPPVKNGTPGPATTSRPCQVVFSDNFDNGIGSEWIREGEGGEGFRMANGQLTHTGEKRGTLWLEKRDWTDVAVDVDVAGAGCGGGYTAILLRMQDPSNYVGVVIAHGCLFATGGIYLMKNGQQTTLVQGQGNFGHWRIEAVGNLYKVFPGGQSQMSATDETFTHGSVGISMGNGSLDNFKVCQYSLK